MDETPRLGNELSKTREFSEIRRFNALCGTAKDHEHVRDAYITGGVFCWVTVDDSLAINNKFYDCILNNCVLRDCPQEYLKTCRFVDCVFEGCSPPADGKFQGLTTVLDDSKGGFKFTLLPTELKEKIMKYAFNWRGKTPPLIAALRNGKREKNRLETFDHELAVQTLSRENVYRFDVNHGEAMDFPAMRTIRRLYIE
jgi:hypothetical protein